MTESLLAVLSAKSQRFSLVPQGLDFRCHRTSNTLRVLVVEILEASDAELGIEPKASFTKTTGRKC
jgi:hypothetical protein